MTRAPGPSREQLLRTIWPYLPVFRTVAETEHLPTAAERLHVSPSALSRTVKLLEEQLGMPLFVRSSRRIALNAAGRAMLAAVGRSMSALDRALEESLDEQPEGDLHVASLGVLTDHFVLPALLDLQQRHPGVVPCMTTLLASDANRQLGAGRIELAFYYDATTSAGITCEHLGQVGNSIYVGVGHELFGHRDITRRELLRHPFSVAAIGDRGTPMDGWPVHLPRTIGFRIYQLSTNLCMCLSGRFVTVLPDVVAAEHVAAERLWRLAPDPVPATDVYAAHREEDEGRQLIAEVIDAVRGKLERTAEQSRELRRAARSKRRR